MDNLLLELFCHVKYSPHDMYIVGGSVRDYLLKKPIKDIDLVTNYPIDELAELLKEQKWTVKVVGLHFPILLVKKNNTSFEVASYRHGTIEQDCLYRDLTINSLYYEPFTGLIRDVSGQSLSDIKNKVIRFNGKPKDRIIEDPLRILRVYRFANKYGFSIEKETLKACRKHFEMMVSTTKPQRMINEIETMVGLL